MTFTVLVVDDNFDHRFLTKRALKPLEQEGRVAVIVAEDGESALEKLAARPLPDLVLMDIKMPRRDGFEVLGDLRRDPETSKLPVVMFTSSENKTDVERARVLGANAYLTKPLDAREFQDKVKALVLSWLSRQA